MSAATRASAKRPGGRRPGLWHSRAGAAAVEFAFVFPIVLIMLISVLEFGRYFWIKHTLQYTVEEVGRSAMAHFTRQYWAIDEGTESCAGADDPPTKQQIIDCAAAEVETEAEADALALFLGWHAGAVTFFGTETTAGNPDILLIEGTIDFEFFIPLIPSVGLEIYARTRVPLIGFDKS